MKTHPLLTLLLFASLWPLLPATAQKFVVDRFEETNDLAARQYPCKDANGELCALVKVEVVDDVTKAEFGVVGDVISKGVEKWVYIIANQRNFKLQFAKHVPVDINTRDYGINGLVGGTTYVLTLIDPAATAPSVNVSPQNHDATMSDGSLSFTVKDVTFKMIKVEGGTFTMGAEASNAYYDEKPSHQVTLSTYYIGQTEVTQALWQAVMGINPSYFKGDDLPVEKVSWENCQTFIRKLNKKTGQNFCLPTEAEWEFAARGGNASADNAFSGSDDLDDVAWYDTNSDEKTHPVATKKSNELGIYDMTGNVWEWCADWYGTYTSTLQTNPTGATSGTERVKRGGSWKAEPNSCRVTCRDFRKPAYWDCFLGLRLALHVEPTENEKAMITRKQQQLKAIEAAASEKTKNEAPKFSLE